MANRFVNHWLVEVCEAVLYARPRAPALTREEARALDPDGLPDHEFDVLVKRLEDLIHTGGGRRFQLTQTGRRPTFDIETGC